jgi:HlyD family secretion protein
MAIGQSGSVAAAIQSLWTSGACTGVTDGQLLDRFATAAPDDANSAFEALVQRHGPMVLRVCRDVLQDTAEVACA